MPTDPDTSALQRLARDLRRIREDRDVALSTIHEATQVPESQLESFEAGTLYEESTLTPVYLRGFVQAYAEAIGVPPDSVLDSLDSALTGEYENQLADQYLEVPPSVSESDSSESVDSSAERSDDPESEERAKPPPSDARLTSEVSTRDSEERDGEEEGGVSSSPTSAGTSEPRSPSGPRSRTSSQGRSIVETWERLWSRHRGRLLVAVISLVLFGAVVGLLYAYLGDSSPSGSPADPPNSRTMASAQEGSPDSVSAGDTSQAEESSQPAPGTEVTLGDTLYVTVLASADVRGMRVQQDDDLRRPYWIRDGRAKVFPFTRRITIQNQLDSLRLLLEGYPYPVSRTDEEGRVVITRDTARQFLETPRAPSSPDIVSPDTVWGRAPTSDAESWVPSVVRPLRWGAIHPSPTPG